MAINQTANFVVKAKDSASGPLGKIGGAMGKLSKTSLGAFVGFGAATAAIGTAIGLAVEGYSAAIGKAAAFESAMLNVNSIAKASPAAFKEMNAEVIALSQTLPQSAETLAKGLYDISSSGFAGADGIKVLKAAARAASAGLAQTSESAAGITAVLNAYSYSADEAQRVSDILFKVVDRGVITFPQLASEIGKVTALSSPLGVSLEDVAAGIAVLTKNGIDAENATTQLNAIMQAVLSPTAKATKLAKKLGIDFSATGLKAKGFNGFLADLIKKTGGSNEAIAELLGDARAIRGAFVLAKNGGEQFNQELELMKNSAGATNVALSYQKQGLNYQLQTMQNKIDAIAIGIGNALIPAVSTFLESIENAGAGLGRVVEESFNPFMETLGETSKMLRLEFGGVDQKSFFDTLFKPLQDKIDAANNALKIFNFLYKEMLRLTGQPIPVAISDMTGPGYTVDPNTGRQIPIGGPGSTPTTTVVNVSIGTEKVDTVVAGSLRRIRGGRNE